jgi:hypothetical protein
MSAEAGSGGTGRSIGSRFRLMFMLAGFLGVLLLILQFFLWVAWGGGERSWAPATPPGWYVAPAQIVPESLRREAARGMCYVAVLANSSFESGPCRDADTNLAGPACFAAAKNEWCADGRIPVSAALWLLLAFSLIRISVLGGGRVRRANSAAERHRQLKRALLNVCLGLFMVGWAYQTVHLGDVIILKSGTNLEQDPLKSGCAVRSGHCVLDISSRTPPVLLWIAMGSLILVDGTLTAYRRRRDFFYRPDANLADEK